MVTSGVLSVVSAGRMSIVERTMGGPSKLEVITRSAIENVSYSAPAPGSPVRPLYSMHCRDAAPIWVRD